MNKIFFTIIFFIGFAMVSIAQNKAGNEPKGIVSKSDNGWQDVNESTTNPQITIVDGISFYATTEGVFITLPKATNNVKLFALTGEIVWSGDLVQGKFLIPTKRGIYFLRINNKSYKVVCK